MKKFTSVNSKLAALFLGGAMVFMSTFAVPVSAVDLNSVGGGDNAVVQETNGGSGADYVSEDTFKTLYGDTTISQEEAQKAAELAAPVVKVVRTVMSILLAVLPAVMLLNCILDIVCLTISPLRKAMMAAHGAGGSAGGMGSGMGMGMGMGGMGGMGGSSGGEPQGIMQTIAQWASKEAVDAVTECTGGAGAASGMGMGMGMGMGGGAPAPKPKMLLTTYFKKKVVFLVMFGICIIVFSCNTFTDLGLKFGAWLVNKVAGIDI